MQRVSRKKQPWMKIIGIFLALVFLVAAGVASFALLGKAPTEKLPLQGVSAAALADGVYEGSYSGFRWSNAVSVTVEDHRISGILITKPQVAAKAETFRALTDRVLASQTTAVDTVSGATIDSKAYLKAIENALTSAG